LALELERAERARFDAGDSQLLIVNLREQQTAEAELREVDAMLDYHRASADLKAACGQ
jgi:outer membrane protein TolC